MNRAPLLFLLAALSLGGPSTGQEWPRFRGPDGAGHVDGPLPVTWSTTENIEWKTELPGRGWSSPVLLSGQVWLTTALVEERSLRALAVEADTGRILHDIEVFRPAAWEEIHSSNGYASPTAVLEGDRAWVHFGAHGTAGLDAKDGTVLWRNDEIRPDYEVGAGSSPILWRDLLIVPFDGTDVQEIVAFDKITGEIAWRRPRGLPSHYKPPHRKAFTTPLVVDTDRRSELVVPGAQQVVAYDPGTGRPLWTVTYDGYSIVPSPIAGVGHVFVTTGYMQPRLLAVRPGGIGIVTESHVDWSYRWQVPRNATPLMLGDRLFMVSDQGRATWLNARTGERVWAERLDGNTSASPIEAAGRVYVSFEDGRVLVLHPDDEGPRPLATNDLDAPLYATPAGSEGKLYIRTDRHLFRIGGPPVPEPAP